MRRSLLWPIASVLMSLLVMGASGITYTGWVQERSDQRWCDLFASLDPAGDPPTTERGRAVQEQIRELKREFHCPP